MLGRHPAKQNDVFHRARRSPFEEPESRVWGRRSVTPNMGLLKPDERKLAEAISRLAYCNPFLPERIEGERTALGNDFVPGDTVWSIGAESSKENPNVGRLGRVVDELATRLRERLVDGGQPTADERHLYQDLVLYLLYHRYEDDFLEAAIDPQSSRGRVHFYSRFVRDAQRFLAVPEINPPANDELGHIFACLFQVRRAFHHIFGYIVGTSLPAARLRAAVWQSIFTHDMRRYRRALYRRMGDVTTLITGPSGTGKELVARAIGLSRYIPFDWKSESFVAEMEGTFHALNLSALSPTLIESELFGHKKGAFTGALQDRVGWLEVCPPLGTVFLDEIGELDVGIQVKLLRVLQSREFQRLGETLTREFRGKMIAATNRDLVREMRDGRFREDLYYRLCSDLIVTPSLQEQLADSPTELGHLVLFVCRRIAGPGEAERLAHEVREWIQGALKDGYPWPGNFRELEQCVRNILIRKEYRPPRASSVPREMLAEALWAGKLTADELLSRYCTLVYARTGNYQETARRLGIDRRTVKAKIDAEFLETLRGVDGPSRCGHGRSD